MAKGKNALTSSQKSKMTDFFKRKDSSTPSVPSSSQGSSQTAQSSSPNRPREKTKLDRFAEKQDWKISNSQPRDSHGGSTPLLNTSIVMSVSQGIKPFALPSTQQLGSVGVKGISTLKRRDTNVMSPPPGSPIKPPSVISLSSGSVSERSHISVSSGSLMSDSSGPLVPMTSAQSVSIEQRPQPRHAPATPTIDIGNNLPQQPIRRLTRSTSRSAAVVPAVTTSFPRPSNLIPVVEIVRRTPSPTKRKDMGGMRAAVSSTSSGQSETKKRKLADPASDTEEIIIVSTKTSPTRKGGKQISYPLPSKSKRPKHDRAQTQADGDLEVIPTSQSDERELIAPKAVKKDMKEVRDSVLKWQSSQQHGQDLGCGDDFSAMDVDVDLGKPYADRSSAHPTPSSGRTESDSTLHTPTFEPPILRDDSTSNEVSEAKGFAVCSPTLSAYGAISSSAGATMTLSRVPADFAESSPTQMDSQTKTAAIIKRIKLNAMKGAVTCSPDPEEKKYEELSGNLSDSSDEDELFLGLPRKTENADADGFESPLTEIEDMSPSRSRSTKKERSSLSPSKSNGSGMKRKLRSPPLSSTKVKEKKSAEKKRVDPFLALMGGKDVKRKRSNGITSGLKFNFTNSALTNSKPADVVVTDSISQDISTSYSSTPPHSAGDYDIDINRLLVDGKDKLAMQAGDVADMRRIFAEDRAEQTHGNSKGKAKLKELPVVRVWDDDPSESSTMEVDFVMDPLPSPTSYEGTVRRSLRRYVDSNDVWSVALLFDSGALLSISEDIMPWLVDLALSQNDTLAIKSCIFLRDICVQDVGRNAKCFVLSAKIITRALDRMGMKANFFSKVGTAKSFERGNCHPNRRAAIFRLLFILETFIAANRFEASEDIPSCIALLLCVAVDKESEVDIQTSIAKVIESLCIAFCKPVVKERDNMELAICRQCLEVSSEMAAESKKIFLSCLPGGTPLVRRISQWIAFGMLGGDTAVDLASESEDLLPPLSALSALVGHGSNDLIPEETAQLFNIRKDKSEDDEVYVKLDQKVRLLSVILSNIPAFVMEERAQRFDNRSSRAPSQNQLASNSPSGGDTDQEDVSLGEFIRLLALIGNKIQDGSSFPDRSVAKETIERLCMRVTYQLSQTSKMGRESGKPRARKLDGYFKGKA